MSKSSRPDEALKRLMAQRVDAADTRKLPPRNSEAFARQLLRQALEGDVKTQKLIVELLEGCGQEEALPHPEVPLEIVLRVVGQDADTDI
ncbi:MAG: hypothetical protein IKV55_06345 [Oscillospiraceae bacterium]|nr:hypothetical protein [Oscillospiraceae bacterium]